MVVTRGCREGDTWESLFNGYEVSTRDPLYHIAPILNNEVLYTQNIFRRVDLKLFSYQEKGGDATFRGDDCISYLDSNTNAYLCPSPPNCIP